MVHHICDADPNTHPDTVKADAEGLAAQRKKLFGTGAPLELQETVVTALLACVILSVPSHDNSELKDDCLRQLLRTVVVCSHQAVR